MAYTKLQHRKKGFALNSSLDRLSYGIQWYTHAEMLGVLPHLLVSSIGSKDFEHHGFKSKQRRGGEEIASSKKAGVSGRAGS